MARKRAPYNRTITLTAAEIAHYRSRLLCLDRPAPLADILDRTICQDLRAALPFLPRGFADLLILDPPYNLTKVYNGTRFRRITADDYATWLDGWLGQLAGLLKKTASVYICSEWRTSAAVFTVAAKHFHVRNRLTWEREKGRGARKNWKNCAEDIWFCTLSDTYTFNIDAVKLKRKVRAPYTWADGQPKDWQETPQGNFRLTHPSNLWTDITVPFWSMPENTDHPTQKPEKLLAKLVLASSNPGEVVLDPFLGSGTTSVAARKLGRQFVGIELEESFACLAEKRLALATQDRRIQGYHNGVFWERNTLTKPR